MKYIQVKKKILEDMVTKYPTTDSDRLFNEGAQFILTQLLNFGKEVDTSYQKMITKAQLGELLIDAGHHVWVNNGIDWDTYTAKLWDNIK